MASAAEGFDDLAAMDGPAIRAARKAEVEFIEGARGEIAGELYKDARAYNEFLEQSFAGGGDKRFARLMGKSRAGVRNALDNPKMFARYKGARMLDALQMQESALDEYLAAAKSAGPAAAEPVASAAASVGKPQSFP